MKTSKLLGTKLIENIKVPKVPEVVFVDKYDDLNKLRALHEHWILNAQSVLRVIDMINEEDTKLKERVDNLHDYVITAKKDFYKKIKSEEEQRKQEDSNIRTSFQGDIDYIFALMEGVAKGMAAGIDYDEQSKQIRLLNNFNMPIASIDATAFIKDGMVESVSVLRDNLVMTFNTDSGKLPITIPMSAFFLAENYYNKQDIDEMFAATDLGEIDINLASLDTIQDTTENDFDGLEIYTPGVYKFKTMRMLYNEQYAAILIVTNEGQDNIHQAIFTTNHYNECYHRYIDVDRNTINPWEYFIPEGVAKSSNVYTKAEALSLFTPKIAGKGLSTNDFTNYYKSALNGIIHRGDEEILYKDLVELKRKGRLVSGKTYIITDYIVFADDYYRNVDLEGSTGFLVVVTALSADKLSNEAWGIDTTNNNKCYKIYYSLDNDKSKFDWFDELKNVFRARNADETLSKETALKNWPQNIFPVRENGKKKTINVDDVLYYVYNVSYPYESDDAGYWQDNIDDIYALVSKDVIDTNTIKYAKDDIYNATKVYMMTNDNIYYRATLFYIVDRATNTGDFVINNWNVTGNAGVIYRMIDLENQIDLPFDYVHIYCYTEPNDVNNSDIVPVFEDAAIFRNINVGPVFTKDGVQTLPDVVFRSNSLRAKFTNITIRNCKSFYLGCGGDVSGVDVVNSSGSLLLPNGFNYNITVNGLHSYFSEKDPIDITPEVSNSNAIHDVVFENIRKNFKYPSGADNVVYSSAERNQV